MLSVFEKGIIELIKGSLTGSVPQIDSEFDYEKAYEYAQQRQITPLLYYGAVNTPGFMDAIYGKRFFKSTMNLSFYCSEQVNLIETIKEAFEKNQINFVLLKGTVVRGFYPCPEMRLMSDADILIKEEEYEKIRPIMVSLGFEEQYESDHELVWKKSGVTVELHKRLIPSYNKDYYEYFGDGWKLATVKAEDSNQWFMSNEDCFIYILVHFAKHYRDMGIGIKHLTDFYVYLEKYPDLDFGYIDKELEKLQILEFWKNIKSVIDAWFSNGEWNEKNLFLTRKIISNLAYGSEDNRTQARALKASKKTKHFKLKRYFLLVFPGYTLMADKYPVLKKVPILLPFMWIARWFTALICPKKIKNQVKRIEAVNEKTVSQYQSELNYVGLDFNFE